LFFSGSLVFLFFLLVNLQRAAAQVSEPFCGFTITENWTNAKISNIVLGTGLPPAGSVIVVTGTLTIDISVTFQNFDFIMKPESSIKVLNSNIFPGVNTVMTANGCRFFACRSVTIPRMWRGMEVLNNASVKFSQVTISDAWMGINFLPSADRGASSIDNSFIQLSTHGIIINVFRPFSFTGNTIRAK